VLAGAVIGIGHDGNLDMRRGLIRPEDKATARKVEKTKRAAGERTKGEGAAGFSAALIEDLTAHRTAGLQAKLADNPKVALAAVVHALALGVFYSTVPGESVVRIRPTVTALDQSAEGIEATPALKQLAATTKAAAKGMPKDAAKLWEWLSRQEQKRLLAILAVCAAHTLDAVQKKHDPVSLDHADELAAALKLDMAAYWQPTAAGYFARLSKQQVLAAVADGDSKEAAENLAKLKKDELAKQAEKRLKTSGWLPPILRAAGPAGRSSPAPAAMPGPVSLCEI
jgi:ParB family chromosome partitioning protein